LPSERRLEPMARLHASRRLRAYGRPSLVLLSARSDFPPGRLQRKAVALNDNFHSIDRPVAEMEALLAPYSGLLTGTTAALASRVAQP
jgi:hypothetical protein